MPSLLLFLLLNVMAYMDPWICDKAIFTLPLIFSFIFLFLLWVCKKKFCNHSKSSTYQCFGIATENTFLSRDHRDIHNTTGCVIKQPLIIKNALNTVVLLRALGCFSNIFSGNKSNYLYYFYISICNWYFPIKGLSCRFGKRRPGTVGGRGRRYNAMRSIC